MDIFSKVLQGALLDAQHPDDKIREAAQGKLTDLQGENLPNFLLSLAAELSRDASSPECQRLAGSILKDLLDQVCSADGDQWINLDLFIKSNIKESLLEALGSSVYHAPQVIAKVAYIEMPRGEWRDLTEKLLANVAQQDASPPLKQGTLEALGYVTEKILELDPDESNNVLNVVVQAMNQAELTSEVRPVANDFLNVVVQAMNQAELSPELRLAGNDALDVVIQTMKQAELSSQVLLAAVAPVVGLLMGRMEDPILEVRVAAACTLARAAFERLHSPAHGNRVFTNDDLPRIITVLEKSTRAGLGVCQNSSSGMWS